MSLENVLLVLAVVIGSVALYKIWRVHLLLFRLAGTAEDTRSEVHRLFALVQALLALERSLALDRPLPPLRGWAGSPDFLLHVHHALREGRPQVVLECSSGVSTVVSARTLQMNGLGHVYALEHSAEYAQKTRKLLADQGLSAWATVLHAPLTQEGPQTPWYDLSALASLTRPIDFVVIDGPPSSIAPKSRAPALQLLKPYLAPGFTLILDDASRPDEAEIVREWMRTEPGLEMSSLPAEKGCTVLTMRASSGTAA